MWLALAKLSSYKDAQKVLNEARKHVTKLIEDLAEEPAEELAK